mgnify:CR=1 FL=1
MSVEEAKEEAIRHIENAIQIFKEVSKVFSSLCKQRLLKEQ